MRKCESHPMTNYPLTDRQTIPYTWSSEDCNGNLPITLSQKRLHTHYEENSREEMTSMANNMYLLNAKTRPCGFNAAYGLAMPCAAPEWVICDTRFRMLMHIFGASGISVPISRGSPPVLTE
jgi:hypothetical protein